MSDTKTIVITGATRGLGKALAERFIALGHTVAGCGRSSDLINRMQKKWAAPHHFAVVDVTDSRQMQAWADDVLAAQGAPDVLINNAGVVNHPASLWQIPTGEFSALIDINIKGVFHSLRAFLPSMVEKNSGVVINMSSGWGRSVSPDVAPYCASKYAIEGLSKAVAEEVPSGMAVVPLNPGMIDTDMLRICFGLSAAHHATPATWAVRAADFILGIEPRHNGQSLSV